MEKQQQIDDWFYAPVPSFQLKSSLKWFGGLLIILLIISQVFTKQHPFINWVLFAGILAILFFKFVQPYLKEKARYNGRPADTQVDQWAEDEMKDIVSLAAKKFDIDEEDEDELKAPTYVGCFPVGDITREGSDGKWRYAEWAFHLFFFKEDSILYYHGLFNTLDSKIISEANERVFYKDIISPKSKKEGEQIIFELGGTDIRISYYPGYYLPFHGKNHTSDVDFTVRAIEKLMHSTKYKTS